MNGQKIIDAVKKSMNLYPHSDNIKDIVVEEKDKLYRILLWAKAFGLFEWEVLKIEFSKLDLSLTSFEVYGSEEGLIHVVIYAHR
jgi:hypothetical protein